MSGTLWGIQVFCTFALTGLIWVIQLVHYPAFARVDDKQFQAFHQFHSRRISWLVIPLMMGELLTAALLVAAFPAPLWIGNLALAIAPWVFTFAFSVPAHNSLAQGYEPGAHARLVNTNWLRTMAWSAKALLLLQFV